jgi:hypothetical protein
MLNAILLIMLLLLGFLILGFLVYVLFLKSRKHEEDEVYEYIRAPVVLKILVPRENDKTPIAAEQMFASLHGILRDKRRSLDLLSFEIVSSGENGIKFYVVSPSNLANFVEGQIYAQYPNAEIDYVDDYTKCNSALAPFTRKYVNVGGVELEKGYIFPVKTFRNFDVDPLAAITSAVSDLRVGEEAWIQLLIRPVGNYWQEDSKAYIEAIRDGKNPSGETFWQKFGKFLNSIQSTSEDSKLKEVVKLAPGQEEELAEIENKMLKLGFEVGIRIVTKAQDELRSQQILDDVVASFKQFTTAHLNNFTQIKTICDSKETYTRYLRRGLNPLAKDILTVEELASVFHLPNISVETPNINWSRARKAEPPMNLPLAGTEDVNIFAQTDYRGERLDFGLKRRDRSRHFYLLGKTGVGKTTVFKNMIISDILAGDGVCYVDPHGQDVEDILEYIPEERLDDVVYFNPSDVENPVGFNLLQLNDPTQRDLVADGVVEVFKKQFGDSWGPRLQYIMQNAVATCLEAQGVSLLAVLRILIDKNYRKFILKHVEDPILKKFWEEEFASMASNSRLMTEAIAPIQNKVGRFISTAVIRNIIGQIKSTIDLRDIMDNKKIFLVNLAQGKIGEENCALLGGMLITRLQSTAMERVDIPFEERRDFFLYVDEFQNFATESFAKILSEARKFKLNLTMTNQYIEQLPLNVRNAIFGNVGTLGSFVVSQSDASILANEFAPIFSAEDLVSLESHSMYMKLCIDGMTSKPFSAKSLDVRFDKMGCREEIIRRSREKFGMPKVEIEDKVRRWAEQKYSESGNRSKVS